MARLGGAPSAAAVELTTQNFYFAFQVVQVFLVVTLASSASSVVTKIINNPSSAATLLANNIPTVSNFYISYIILQGLSFSSGALLQITGLILGKVLGRLLDNTPRKMYTRWSSLAGLGWGTVYPAFTLLAVIGKTILDSPALIDILLNPSKSSHHLRLYRPAGIGLCKHRSLSVLFRLPVQHAVRVER